MKSIKYYNTIIEYVSKALVIITVLMDLLYLYISLKFILLFKNEFKRVSKSSSIYDFKTKFINNYFKNRYGKAGLFFDGTQTSFKEPKSKSLERYDLIRADTYFR